MPEHIVLDVLDQPLPLLCGQRNALLLDHRVQLAPYECVQLLLAQRRIVESRAKPIEERRGRTILELGERVGRRRGSAFDAEFGGGAVRVLRSPLDAAGLPAGSTWLVEASSRSREDCPTGSPSRRRAACRRSDSVMTIRPWDA